MPNKERGRKNPYWLYQPWSAALCYHSHTFLRSHLKAAAKGSQRGTSEAVLRLKWGKIIFLVGIAGLGLLKKPLFYFLKKF